MGVHSGCRRGADEAPMAYKNYNHVMEQQSDMVEIISQIKPIINVKG